MASEAPMGHRVINGTAGNDVICGMGGDDWIAGGVGDDGTDVGAGNTLVNGGAGIGLVTYRNVGAGITVAPQQTGAATVTRSGGAQDVLVNFENLTGTNFDDRITWTVRGAEVRGGPGDDEIWSGDGQTTIGGPGYDILVAGPTGTLNGGLGGDICIRGKRVTYVSCNDLLAGII